MRPYETRKSYKYDQFSPYRLVSSWLPGEGISREVIQADIRRYLGSEATIIPSERDGAHGYHIRARRMLTTSMIEDLMSDSRRWEEEEKKVHQSMSFEPYSNETRERSNPRQYPGSLASYVDPRTGTIVQCPPFYLNTPRPIINISPDRPSKLPTFQAGFNPNESVSRNMLDESYGPDSDLAPSLVTTGPFIRQGRLLELQLLLNKVPFIALPDSGATRNSITIATVDSLGLGSQIRPGRQSFIIGNGQSVPSVGEVSLDCSFMDLPEKPVKEDFFVFDRLVDGVSTILGLPCLRKWQIYGRYQFRLRERTFNFGPRVALLTTIPDAPSTTWPAFKIKLNGSVELCFADTGSDIDLVREDWATQRRLKLRPIEFGDSACVQLATGGQHPLHKKVILHIDTLQQRSLKLEELETANASPLMNVGDINLPDSKGYSSVWKPKPSDQYRTFFVFKDLPFNVILGQRLLDSIDAYGTHGDAFVTVGPGGQEITSSSAKVAGQDRLNVIRSCGWLSRFTSRGASVSPAERTAFLTWLQYQAQTQNSSNINNELLSLIQLHELIVDYERAIETGSDSRRKRDYNDQKKGHDEHFRNRAESVRRQFP